MIVGEQFSSRGFLSAKRMKAVGPATTGLSLRSRLVGSDHRACRNAERDGVPITSGFPQSGFESCLVPFRNFVMH